MGLSSLDAGAEDDADGKSSGQMAVRKQWLADRRPQFGWA